MPSARSTFRTLALPTALAALAGIAAGQFLPCVQDPGTDEPVPSADEDAGRALKRVLYLTGGSTLRVIAREQNGEWEMRRHGSWRPVGAPVERVALERELLGELRGRRADVPEADFDARAELARWTLGTGLLEEGLAEIDDILAADPDRAAAREVLASEAHRFRVPPAPGRESDAAKTRDELLRWAAPRPASGRELALLQLARDADREALGKALAEDLFSTSVKRRGFATLALRRLFAGREVRALLHRAVLDPSDEVRHGAALALHDVDEPGLVVPVVRAMESSTSQRVRAQAAQALGDMGYATAVQPLVARLAALQGASAGRVAHANIFVGRQFAYVQDYDVEVAQFQSAADPQVNVLVEGAVLDAGVIGVEQVHFTVERNAIRGSLGQLTGANPGRRSADWLAWWEQNAADWQAARPATEE